MLHELLRGHPAISGFCDTGVPQDEGQHLQSVYPAAKVFGGPGKFGFDPASHMDENHPLATPENAEKLLLEWSRYWDLSKAFLVEKSPPNLVRTRFLQKLFPDSHFVVILRHPVAVAMATQKWSKTSSLSLLKHGLLCYQAFAKDAPHLHNVYVLRYEDFVINPEVESREIFAWLGVEPYKANISVRPDDNEKYYLAWEKGAVFSTGSEDAYAFPLLEEALNQYGYSFGGDKVLPWKLRI